MAAESSGLEERTENHTPFTLIFKVRLYIVLYFSIKVNRKQRRTV